MQTGKNKGPRSLRTEQDVPSKPTRNKLDQEKKIPAKRRKGNAALGYGSWGRLSVPPQTALRTSGRNPARRRDGAEAHASPPRCTAAAQPDVLQSRETGTHTRFLLLIQDSRFHRPATERQLWRKEHFTCKNCQSSTIQTEKSHNILTIFVKPVESQLHWFIPINPLFNPFLQTLWEHVILRRNAQDVSNA